MKIIILIPFLFIFSFGFSQISWSEWYGEDSIVNNQKWFLNGGETLLFKNVKIKDKLYRLEYFPTGELRIRAQIIQERFDTIWFPMTMEIDTYCLLTYFIDIEEGKYIEYYSSGNIKKIGRYKSGLIGKWEHYWDTGEIQLIIDWDKNGYMKKYSNYFSNGKLEKKGRYIRIGNREVKIGVWKYYLPNGKLEKKVKHKKPNKETIRKNEQTLKSLNVHY